jgi:hypothetical protein
MEIRVEKYNDSWQVQELDIYAMVISTRYFASQDKAEIYAAWLDGYDLN